MDSGGRNEERKKVDVDNEYKRHGSSRATTPIPAGYSLRKRVSGILLSAQCPAVSLTLIADASSVSFAGPSGLR